MAIFSVIIPTYNRLEQLRLVLDNIINQEYPYLINLKSWLSLKALQMVQINT
jgi:glycosyltransferase involved in cell wall biosynthesis